MSSIENFKESENTDHNDLQEVEEEKLNIYDIICPHCHREATAEASKYGMPSKCDVCSLPIWLYRRPENFSLATFLRIAMIISKISLIVGISQVAAQLICGIMLFFVDIKEVFLWFMLWSLINFITILFQLIFLYIENKMGWNLVPRWLARPFSSYVETTTTTVLFIPIDEKSRAVTKYKHGILKYLFNFMTGKETLSDNPSEVFTMYFYAPILFFNALFFGAAIFLYETNVLEVHWMLVSMVILILLFVKIISSFHKGHNDFVINAAYIVSILPEKITFR